jgi:hypothetical protein
VEDVQPGLLSTLVLAVHILLVAGIAVRILSRHLPVGTTLAWLIVLFVLPILGPALYLFIGENRLGQKRADRWRVIHDLYRKWQAGPEGSAPRSTGAGCTPAPSRSPAMANPSPASQPCRGTSSSCCRVGTASWMR